VPKNKAAIDKDAMIARLEKQLEQARLQIRLLAEQLRLERIRKYGPSSEKLSSLQLELLDLEPGVTVEEVNAEAERETLSDEALVDEDHEPDSATTPKVRSRPRHPGRQKLPGHLPRVERIIACPGEECRCKLCGGETAVIGHEESEYLDKEPARYFVVVTRREKRACPGCAHGGVKIAPVPERIVEKGLVSDAVVIDTLVAKYGDHVPLYRQSAILRRDLDIEISRATMDGWVIRCGDLLRPVAAAMARELLADGYIQADETPVPVQSRGGKGRHDQAFLWQYGRPGGSTVFDFRPGRGREGPKKFPGEFQGILQTDGYSAYDKTGGKEMVHAACWAHARRKLFDAVKLSPEDRVAARLLSLIDQLFGVDREARDAGMDNAARHALRQQRSLPLLHEIRSQLEAAGTSALPASALGKAVAYTLSLWRKLTRFTEHPELELSNNIAENSMRPVALGRKNWIHVGSEDAGPKIAALLSVFESCRRMGLPVREYLSDILPKLASLPLSRVAECTPAAWRDRSFQWSR
jgi:transposase